MLPKMQDFVFPLFAILSGILAQDINSLPECEVSHLPDMAFERSHPSARKDQSHGTTTPRSRSPTSLLTDFSLLIVSQRNCVNLGVRVGPNLGCPATDNGQSAPTCLCNSTQFAYAIRDCAAESCPQGTNIQQVNEYGIQYCQSGTKLPLLLRLVHREVRMHMKSMT